MRLRALETSSRDDLPGSSTVLEPCQQHPAVLVEQHDAGGVTNGRDFPGSHTPSLLKLWPRTWGKLRYAVP
jgi:hypothetical protein